MSDIPPPPQQPSFPQPAPPPGSGPYQPPSFGPSSSPPPSFGGPSFGGPSFQPVTAPSRSGKALASMILGIIGLVLAIFVVGAVLAILALIFGILALREIGRSGGLRTGKGMAISGVVLGIVGLVIAAVVLVVVISEVAGTTSVADLEVGDCVALPDDGDEISRIETFDCTEPHGAEVIAVADIGEGDEEFPGVDEISERAFEDCVEEFEDYIGTSYFESDFQIFPITPIEENWDDDQVYICLAYEPDEELTESIEGAER